MMQRRQFSMLRSRAGSLALAALVAMAGSCVRPWSPSPRYSVVPAGSTAPAAGYVTDHVVIISIDGLRPDAIERFGASTIARLMREGSHTLSAQTILPSKTLPSHTSMLTGVPPEIHGITWNDDRTGENGRVRVPTVFGIARDGGFRTAAFFSKTKFHHLEAEGSLDFVRSPRTAFLGPQPAERIVEQAASYLATDAPNLLFLHFAEPDYAGHAFGWMTRPYGAAVREADRAVARLVRTADARLGRANYTLIITADHGGHGRNHGSADPRDTTIPWIVWGEGVRGGTTLGDGIRTMDTAATALWLLGIGVPDAWVGRAVRQAFLAPER